MKRTDISSFLKSVLFPLLVLLTPHSWAQMVSFEQNTLANYTATNQAQNSLNIILDSFTVTLTQAGPIQITGFVNNSFNTGTSFAYQLVVRVDGTVAYQSPYYSASDGYQSIAPIAFAALTANLASGAHTVEIAYTSAWTWGNNAGSPIYVPTNVISTTNSLIFAPNEPSSGVTEALDQLRQEFLAADAALRTELIALINTAIAGVQQQLDAMNTQLGGEIVDLQAALTQLQATVQDLQDQINNLPVPTNYGPQIANLQSQINGLRNQGATGTSAGTVSVSGNNNNWWWGVAAGAGAGIGTAIIAEQFSAHAKAASENNHSNPPGYYETH